MDTNRHTAEHQVNRSLPASRHCMHKCLHQSEQFLPLPEKCGSPHQSYAAQTSVNAHSQQPWGALFVLACTSLY